MSRLALKRVQADIKNISRSNLADENIHVWVNDENIFNMKVMIVGPNIKNSPYRYGFYFFEMNIPKNYPLEPPKVEFITTDGHIRFNPNLYASGKVCLSILNTWNGPGWTTASTLTMVLLSLQSILHEKPIQNEPGYENEDGIKSKNYNNFIAYHNIKRATINMIMNPPNGYEVFKEIMIKFLINNIENYKMFIDEYAHLNDKKILSGIYVQKINKYDIIEQKKQLILLYSKFNSN